MTNLIKQKFGLEWFRKTFRQWRYPAEFRINGSVWPEKTVEQLAEALSTLPSDVKNEPPGLNGKHLAAIGNRLWQLRVELVGKQESTKPETLRHALRHLEILWERFAEAGLDIDDLKGEIVSETGDHPGLKVLAYQPTKKVTCHCVIDTIKPIIKFNKKIIQVGEVIIGYPEESD